MTEPRDAEKLEDIFRILLKEETVPVRQRTKTNCARWDSLVQLNLITMIEQEFSISVSDEEAIDLNSFDTALQIVSEKLRSKSI